MQYYIAKLASKNRSSVTPELELSSIVFSPENSVSNKI